MLTAKWVFGIGAVWTAVLTMLTPLAAEAGVPLFVALRVLIGMGEVIYFKFDSGGTCLIYARIPGCYLSIHASTLFSVGSTNGEKQATSIC